MLWLSLKELTPGENMKLYNVLSRRIKDLVPQRNVVTRHYFTQSKEVSKE